MASTENHFFDAALSPNTTQKIVEENMQQIKEDEVSRHIMESYLGLCEFMKKTKPQKSMHPSESAEANEQNDQEAHARELSKSDIAKIMGSFDLKEVGGHKPEYWEQKLEQAKADRDPEKIVRDNECAAFYRLQDLFPFKEKVTPENQGEYQNAIQRVRNYRRLLISARDYENHFL